MYKLDNKIELVLISGFKWLYGDERSSFSVSRISEKYTDKI